MADDWQIGDLALCVLGMGQVPAGYDERAPNECSNIVEMLAPTVGSKWIVSAVEYPYREEEQCEMVYLGLRGQPSSNVYDARHFSKIHPLSDEEHRAAIRELSEDRRVPAFQSGED